VDRFSTTAAHLFARTSTNGLPAANAAVNFDNQPFITKGLTPSGVSVSYYNFDVQLTIPDDIYAFFKADGTPVAGQNNVIPTIPGDMGYNDFWIVNKVIVPANYVANTLTNETAIKASGYTITKTTIIVNCPVVPFGSTASRSYVAGKASALTIGWYKDMAVAYFNFGEAAITATATGLVPVDDIYVQFNVNPSATNPASGPASGFKTEMGTLQTHNVIASVPGDKDYSPLWNVSFIDNSHFAMVSNLMTAESFMPTMAGATVNCPVIK
jgi:hypothetical protein